MTTLSIKQCKELAYQAGFRNDYVNIIVAIAYAESSLRTEASNSAGNYPVGSVDRGILQFNSYWHSEVSDDCAYSRTSLLCPWAECYRITHGTSFSAWRAYTSGSYQKFLPQVRATAYSTGGGTSPGATPDLTKDIVPNCPIEYVWSPNHGGARSSTRGIVIHSTRSGASSNSLETEYQGTVNYCSRPNSNRNSCPHFVVGPSKICRMVHDADQAWHARVLNATHLGIEVAQPTDNYAFVENEYRFTAMICALWCIKYNIPPQHVTDESQRGIIGHEETLGGKVEGKSDPGHMWNWSHFIDLVKQYYQGIGPSGSPNSPVASELIGYIVMFSRVDAWASNYSQVYSMLASHGFTALNPRSHRGLLWMDELTDGTGADHSSMAIDGYDAVSACYGARTGTGLAEWNWSVPRLQDWAAEAERSYQVAIRCGNRHEIDIESYSGYQDSNRDKFRDYCQYLFDRGITLRVNIDARSTHFHTWDSSAPGFLKWLFAHPQVEAVAPQTYWTSSAFGPLDRAIDTAVGLLTQYGCPVSKICPLMPAPGYREFLDCVSLCNGYGIDRFGIWSACTLSSAGFDAVAQIPHGSVAGGSGRLPGTVWPEPIWDNPNIDYRQQEGHYEFSQKAFRVDEVAYERDPITGKFEAKYALSEITGAEMQWNYPPTTPPGDGGPPYQPWPRNPPDCWPPDAPWPPSVPGLTLNLGEWIVCDQFTYPALARIPATGAYAVFAHARVRLFNGQLAPGLKGPAEDPCLLMDPEHLAAVLATDPCTWYDNVTDQCGNTRAVGTAGASYGYNDYASRYAIVSTMSFDHGATWEPWRVVLWDDGDAIRNTCWDLTLRGGMGPGIMEIRTAPGAPMGIGFVYAGHTYAIFGYGGSEWLQGCRILANGLPFQLFNWADWSFLSLGGGNAGQFVAAYTTHGSRFIGGPGWHACVQVGGPLGFSSPERFYDDHYGGGLPDGAGFILKQDFIDDSEKPNTWCTVPFYGIARQAEGAHGETDFGLCFQSSSHMIYQEAGSGVGDILGACKVYEYGGDLYVMTEAVGAAWGIHETAYNGCCGCDGIPMLGPNGFYIIEGEGHYMEDCGIACFGWVLAGANGCMFEDVNVATVDVNDGGRPKVYMHHGWDLVNKGSGHRPTNYGRWWGACGKLYMPWGPSAGYGEIEVTALTLPTRTNTFARGCNGGGSYSGHVHSADNMVTHTVPFQPPWLPHWYPDHFYATDLGGEPGLTGVFGSKARDAAFELMGTSDPNEAGAWAWDIQVYFPTRTGLCQATVDTSRIWAKAGFQVVLTWWPYETTEMPGTSAPMEG